MKATLQLRRPMLAEELRLETSSSILVEALEVVFDSNPRF
jgi:hypothetical protein